MKTTPDILNDIRRHGAEAYPDECCGFLIGTVDGGDNIVSAIERVENTHGGDRRRRYLIPPGAYRTADRRARDLGLDVVGFYHSHPDHPARPSETDLAEATFPGYTYVILEVVRGRPADISGWALAPDRSHFTAETITTEP